MKEIELLDFLDHVSLWPTWAVAPSIPPLGEPIVTGRREFIVPAGFQGKAVLIAHAEDDTPLCYWRVTVHPGEKVGIA